MSMMPADAGKINGMIEPHPAGWSSTYRTIECRIKEAVVALIMLGCPLIPLYGRALPTCSGPQRSLGSTEKSTGNSWICQWADTLWGRLALMSTKTPTDSWRRWPWNLNPPMAKRTVITGLAIVDRDGWETDAQGYITLHTWQQYYISTTSELYLVPQPPRVRTGANRPLQLCVRAVLRCTSSRPIQGQPTVCKPGSEIWYAYRPTTLISEWKPYRLGVMLRLLVVLTYNN